MGFGKGGGDEGVATVRRLPASFVARAKPSAWRLDAPAMVAPSPAYVFSQHPFGKNAGGKLL